MNKMTLIGLDWAKSVFQVHGVDTEGHVVLKQRVTRAQMAVFFAQREPGVVAMEACGRAHHWARQLASLGHQPQLLSPQYVKPFVRTTTHEAADAEAIATAARQPGMPTVAIKTSEPPAVLAIHRVREGLVKSRTATCNPSRGWLAEFGLVLPVGVTQLGSRLPLEAGATRAKVAVPPDRHAKHAIAENDDGLGKDVVKHFLPKHALLGAGTLQNAINSYYSERRQAAAHEPP